MKKIIEKKYKWVIALILSFMFVVSILNAKNDSLIYDEDAHIPAAYSYLTQHDMRLNPEHPPLLKDLAAIPLLFMNLNFDTSQPFWSDNANDAQWNAGKYFLYGAGNNPDKIIFWSRFPFVILSLLLGLFIFKWARELAGISAGLLALALYAFDPNILGHNHFVTTDIGIAAFMVFSFYYFIKFIKEPTWKNVFLGGIFLGLLQLTKFSSVLAFPVFGFILILYPLVKKEHDRANKERKKMSLLLEYLGKGSVVFLISLVLVYIVYYFNTYNMPQEKLPEVINYYFQESRLNPVGAVAKKTLLAINNYPVMEPVADYLFGIVRVFQRVGGGNVNYFMESVNFNGSLWYFPVVFLLKEPLATLALIIFATGFAFSRIIKTFFESLKHSFKRIFESFIHYIRTSTAEFTMFLFILVYSASSISGNLNIGFRHLLPIIPLIFILTARNIYEFIRKTDEYKYKKIYYVVIMIFVLLLMGGTFLAYPYYMSYFNQFAGGSFNGYKYVTDSNADWGQDLNRLKIFLKEHPEVDKIRLNYFGMADLDYYLKDQYIPWWDSKKPIEPGWYAISTLFLQESIYDTRKSDENSYRWLKNKKPLYQVGTSILIYHVSKKEAEELNNL